MKHKYPRLLVVLCALMIGLGSLWAVPARPGWQTKMQPDGTPITVRLMGDEFYHYWKTQDGKIAKEQEDGTFVVTDEDVPTGEQVAKRRAASKRFATPIRKIGANTMPPRALFILVSFSNLSFKDASATYYKSKLGDSTEGAMSMYNYLKHQSNGQYAPPVDVYGPYTLSNTYATYGTNDSDGNDQDPGQMIVDACNAANADIDFSQYDGNGDGKVDNVYVLYAGKGEADGGAKTTIWPHQWNLGSAGKSLTLDGKRIYAYACSAELNGSGQCAMGTPLHEYGHVIGLPDYYDTEYESTNYTESRTPGEWSIMDQGSYNNNGNTPPNYSIFDKYYLGWVTPKFLAKNAVANVTLTTDVTDGYQITGGTSLVAATATTPATIYYIENRQKTGWDAYLPGHGMIVWQVKYNSSAWSNNNLNNTGGSPRYTVLSASGDPTGIGKATDPFPGTGKVKTWDAVTGCALTEITESGGNITFKYNGGISCHNVVVNATGCTITPSTTCVENGNQLNATIEPTDDTYDFSSATVKRGSTTLTAGVHYSLSDNDRSLSITSSAITGDASDDITITVVWAKNRYSYEFVSQDCTVPADGAVSKNAELNLTITPNSGYTLADAACWEVEMGGNILTYGTDFTYSGTTFNIPSVTGDVVIMANALHPVTWYAEGSVHATNVAVDGKVTLPATDPDDCESGKVFVGWCTESNYSNATTAPTFAKTGDTYSVATYYAVYATAGSGGSSAKSYTFNITPSDFNTTSYAANDNEKTSTATASNASTMDVKWTSSNVMQSSSKIQFKKSVGYIYNSTDLGTIKGVTVTSSAGSFTTYYGDSEQPSLSTTVGGGFFKIKVGGATGTVSNIAITFEKTVGGGASYTDYSTSCGTPCSQTPTMSFANATVDKTTADANFTQAVTISGKGSGQTVAYSSSDETVATVNASGVVTLKGKVGTTTITASVKTSGDYCAASASYTLNVTKAPISVTLHYYDNQVTTLNNQQSPYTLPTTGSYVADACEGDWAFAGWYGSEYAKSETAPTYITQLDATGHAYAVYTTTMTESSAPARAKAEASGTKTFAFATIASANSWANSESYTTVEDAPVTITAQGGGNNGKWYTSGGGSWRMYSGGTVRITVEDGAVTSVTSSPSCSFTITDGVATFSPTARTDFTQIVVNYTTNGGGGTTTTTTYYATSPECVTGCTITPTMSFANEAVTQTTDDEAYVQYVTIENQGSGQTVAYSSSNETVATVSNSGGVTLKGVVGSTTITASVAADGDYCAASASYTITVEACALTGITLNTDNAKTVFLVGDQLTTAGVVVTANYSNCEDKIVKPDGFTYPGNITMEPGTKQVTAHYAEASATYDVTVVAPYTVTWKACGEVFDTQTYAPGTTLVLPTSTPGGNAGKSFVGWTATAHYTGASAPPDLFSAAGGKTVTGNVTYYAVYE